MLHVQMMTVTFNLLRQSLVSYHVFSLISVGKIWFFLRYLSNVFAVTAYYAQIVYLPPPPNLLASSNDVALRA